MSRATYEVAQVLEGNKESLATYSSNTWQLRTLHAIRKCRTSALGGHIDRCDHSSCNKLHLSYNSCRNRHCPKCQGHKQELWIRKREQELLNVPYYHVVFTLPDIINRLCLHRPKEVYTLLFTIAWSVIKDFSKNPTFLGATNWDDRYFAHLGTEPVFASPSALYCTWWRNDRFWEMERSQR